MEKRRLVIVQILQGDEPFSQQQEIVEKLREMGFPATQSSVSRDLAEIGAFRFKDRWVLTAKDRGGVFEKVARYVKEVRTVGPHLNLLVTEPGAGALVSQAIEESEWDEVEGTVAGLNSVLVLTREALFQKLLSQRLQLYLSDDGVEKEGTPGSPGESPEGAVRQRFKP
ncbi:MAG TPA: hypothetical protein VF179_30465 [Thermoanaerobaculia bacterium]|nr:hypothetical protein [Thermoanaerobaculia bacterium]